MKLKYEIYNISLLYNSKLQVYAVVFVFKKQNKTSE